MNEIPRNKLHITRINRIPVNFMFHFSVSRPFCLILRITDDDILDLHTPKTHLYVRTVHTFTHADKHGIQKLLLLRWVLLFVFVFDLEMGNKSPRLVYKIFFLSFFFKQNFVYVSQS